MVAPVTFLVATVLLSSAGPLWAQPAVLHDYLLRPGDVLSIRVQDHPELSISQVTIPPDGEIDVPLVGRLKVVGRSVEQVKDAITTGLRRELRHPIVTVNLTNLAPATVRVYGEVSEPGQFDLVALGTTRLTISAAIGLAGGYTAKADRRYVTVIRSDQRVQRVEMQSGDEPVGQPSGQQVYLGPGDTLIVPLLRESVALSGEIKSPGRYPLDTDTTLLSLVAQAGGLTPQADRSRAIIIHSDGSQDEIDISGLADGTIDASKLPKLRDGDVVLFPQARNDVVVLGQVNRPGTYAIRPKMTVVDAIALANGPTDAADLERVEVVDRDGNKRVVKVGTAHGEIVTPDQPAPELALSGGETIVVPEAVHLVSVLGYVHSPGIVRYRPGDRVLDIVARAGGTIEGKARPQKTLLIRPGESPDAPQIVVCDLLAMVRGMKMDQNIRVRDGDVIYVPGEFDPMTRKDWIRSLLQLGSAIAVWQR